MKKSISVLLKEKIPEIMTIWEQRTLDEIRAAHLQETLALRNSLPVYLTQLVDALSTNIDRTAARKKFDKDASTRIGQKHGRERAGSISYTMDQMIMEYHILRQVVCDVLEEKEPLTDVAREVIICSVEQAVNDAATEFSDTLRDIQEQLSQALAHDIRTPISAAKLLAQTMVKKNQEINPDTEKLKRICSNMDRVDKMISDLLDVSRLRAGQQLVLEYEEFDLDVMVQQISDELNVDAKVQAIYESAGPCMVQLNNDGIRRMIENLVSNGIKYGYENKPIVLKLSQDTKSVTITVHNEGDAIPPDEQLVMFQQYRRAKSAESKKGWGLGLSMVEGMVKAHSGTVRIESLKGKGTSFVVDLPKQHCPKN